MLRFCPLSLKIMEKFVEVREAVREDCQEIRALIQVRFVKRKAHPSCACTVLEKDGFDREDPLFKCYVASCDGKIVGYALYFYIYSTLDPRAIHLEDLYVTPEYREKHIGSRLFDTVAKQTFSERCPYLDFAVLGWNPARSFYKNKGSVDLTETEAWRMYRLGQDSLKHLATNYANGQCEVRQAESGDFDTIKRLAEEASFNTTTRKIKDEKPKIDDVSIVIEGNNTKGDNTYYGYLVGVWNKNVVGYALYCYAYSTWEGKSMYLMEFYASPGEHNSNVRDNLFSAVAKKAYEDKCCRIDFWVLDSKNEGKFYVSNGAVDLTESEEWHLYRLYELTKKSS
ncbi:uncharacterized protein LOC106647866 [Copidosoma floridanum]|uniref:uncharacterized protein LOC106647866 n=1 Tax=Copidosoma floridanum TaxID=29053 RepID=UPI0006C9A8FA|nr:uncharacterized protein LOC106647866 [Copidosoma floridanum]